jgi:hypothetical protein
MLQGLPLAEGSCRAAEEILNFLVAMFIRFVEEQETCGRVLH